jgi:hypothetical protein
MVVGGRAEDPAIPAQRKDPGEVPVLVRRKDLKPAHAEGAPPRARPPGPQERTGLEVLRQPLPFGLERVYTVVDLDSGHHLYCAPVPGGLTSHS